MDVIKEGYIKLKGKRCGIWWRRWLVFYRASSKGPTRLVAFADKKNGREGKSECCIPVHAVQSVVRLSSKVRKFAIAVITKDVQSWNFSCETDGDAEDWLNAVLLEKQKKGVCQFFSTPDIAHQFPLNLKADSYDIYPVRPMANTRLGGFHGECLMLLTAETVHVLDAQKPSFQLVSWEIKKLRKFGMKGRQILLQAGRRCGIDEGDFVFTSTYSDEIYDKLRQHAHVLAGSLVLHSKSHSDSCLSLATFQSLESANQPLENVDSSSNWSIHARPLPKIPD